jgi:hypothetical protein
MRPLRPRWAPKRPNGPAKFFVDRSNASRRRRQYDRDGGAHFSKIREIGNPAEALGGFALAARAPSDGAKSGLKGP